MINIKKLSYNSPVILTFFFLSLLALILNTLTNGAANTYLFSVYRTSFTDLLGYIRVFTHMLGHVDFNHFISNMMIILLVGPVLEEKYTSYNMTVMIIFTALLTGVFNIIFFPDVALLGSSGIGFMLIILVSFVNVKKDTIPLTFILVTILYLFGEFYNSIFVDDNISQVTHIVGGACGGIFGYVLNKNRKIN